MRAKISLITLAFVAAFSSLYAQSNDSKFNFGLKLSPTLAWFKPSGEIKGDGAKIGFAYGLVADINFTANYAFETGIDVTYRGGKIKYDFDKKASSTLQYIELPLTLKLKTNEIGYMTYFGKFGFAPGVNIRATGDISKSDINVPNLALIVGLGTQYSLGGKTSLLVGVTFNNGFLDVLKLKEAKATTNFLALDLGVMF
jgi:hypothetical protein